MITAVQKVYCVVDTSDGHRVSQFYSRKSDAIRKARKLRGGALVSYFKAVEYRLENPVGIE